MLLMRAVDPQLLFAELEPDPPRAQRACEIHAEQ